MLHPHLQDLRRYLRPDADADLRQQIETHLGTCVDCGTRLRLLEQVVTWTAAAHGRAHRTWRLSEVLALEVESQTPLAIAAMQWLQTIDESPAAWVRMYMERDLALAASTVIEAGAALKVESQITLLSLVRLERTTEGTLIAVTETVADTDWTTRAVPLLRAAERLRCGDYRGTVRKLMDASKGIYNIQKTTWEIRVNNGKGQISLDAAGGNIELSLDANVLSMVNPMVALIAETVAGSSVQSYLAEYSSSSPLRFNNLATGPYELVWLLP